jgi:hypothetical protein
VRGFTSSFDSTTNGSLGTKPVALKLERIFAFENALNTSPRVAMKAFLSIWPIWSSAKILISLLYARLRGQNNPHQVAAGCEMSEKAYTG